MRYSDADLAEARSAGGGASRSAVYDRARKFGLKREEQLPDGGMGRRHACCGLRSCLLWPALLFTVAASLFFIVLLIPARRMSACSKYCATHINIA